LEACVVGSVTENDEYTIVFDQGSKKNIKLTMDLEDIFEDVNQNWPHNSWKKQKSTMKKGGKNLTKNVWHQYDWTVGARTLKGPNKPGHFAVVDIAEVGKELVISWSSDEGISNTDPARGVDHAFENCLTIMKKLKAQPLGLTNCLNFGHPRDSMGAFAQTIQALSRNCKKYNVPVVSGNASLYNAYKNHSIKPTPMIVMVGIR
jgi:phosphoribosylformylglycinamidine (FGAM) synthase-like enzyme